MYHFKKKAKKYFDYHNIYIKYVNFEMILCGPEYFGIYFKVLNYNSCFHINEC